ncbi:hypothetical protein LV779_39235 [Streptomyces thinghirensis]|nr:hypothetical protein [Streptomyces thinghirensis]
MPGLLRWWPRVPELRVAAVDFASADLTGEDATAALADAILATPATPPAAPSPCAAAPAASAASAASPCPRPAQSSGTAASTCSSAAPAAIAQELSRHLSRAPPGPAGVVQRRPRLEQRATAEEIRALGGDVAHVRWRRACATADLAAAVAEAHRRFAPCTVSCTPRWCSTSHALTDLDEETFTAATRVKTEGAAALAPPPSTARTSTSWSTSPPPAPSAASPETAPTSAPPPPRTPTRCSCATGCVTR